MKKSIIVSGILVFLSVTGFAQVKLNPGNNTVQINTGTKAYSFLPEFTILYSDRDPDMALRPAGIKKVSYNVLTWKTADSALADFKQKQVGEGTAGDGFDDRILRGKNELRTANLFQAGRSFTIKANAAVQKGDSVVFSFPANKQFSLKVWLLANAKPYPVMQFRFTPHKKGFYSIGYTGAPSFDKKNIAESWQSLIWTEKRTPDMPYLTPAFMATLPTTLVNDGSNTLGVLASPEFLPFQPLPLLTNSQFGVALLNPSGKLQPQVFAPLLGGMNSWMKADTNFNFSFQLIADPLSLTGTYQKVAETVFGFHDYRQNSIASMNTVLDNLIDYSKTHYAWFVDSLKGFAYSTDVPGAVKNVSSLNPLEMAIIRDDEDMFEKRAYPLMEFMLSREKFLFSLDSTQKIQSPSRKLRGPIAPLSELGALYTIFGRQNSFYPTLAKEEFASSRVRNLDDNEKGRNWINAMFLYKMTKDTSYLNLSRKMADEYLKKRVDVRIEQFGVGDPMNSSHFFWPTFTNHWEAFLELYELTGDTSYLRAAHDGARHYALFTWMTPAIPDSLVTVNKGGKAPIYWYLKSKGHEQMYYPEEKVPAWRLSEIGLTPESSGTATGHRGIFMSCYAPWMLRTGYYTNDSFLINLAKASLVGRSTNFPGYHMNTERTTAYEKPDFPLHEHKKQSVNSFHYNHILPMASLFMDYLVSDAYARSGGKIEFPNEYIEGYAYLQNKFYGHAKGKFYNYSNVQLWMPARLVKSGSVELNYVAGRNDDALLLAFSNQSSAPVTTTITLNPKWLHIKQGAALQLLSEEGGAAGLKDSSFVVTVPANGLTALAITPVAITSSFQSKLLTSVKDDSRDFANIPEGNAKAMLFKLGSYGRRLFVYLEDDDNKWKKAQLVYTDKEGKKKTIEKAAYPFEFTVDVDLKKPVQFSLVLTGTDGKTVCSKTVELGK
jgi:hypothetical protein